jgi:hypothetical protein
MNLCCVLERKYAGKFCQKKVNSIEQLRRERRVGEGAIKKVGPEY